jgi:hypothetical protein
MRQYSALCAAFFSVSLLAAVPCNAQYAKDPVESITAVVTNSTLDREGTPPFHLQATVKQPTDSAQGGEREGTIEYWWASPSQWRRELRTKGFHQVLVVNRNIRSQKDEGDYFPEWLRELAVALVRPVPISTTVFRQGLSKAVILERSMRAGNGYRDVLQTNVDWDVHPQDSSHAKSSSFLVLQSQNAFLASSNLLFVSGIGWSGFFEAPKSFHGQAIAQRVSIMNPKTTATVQVLEDLKFAEQLFAPLTDADKSPLETVVVSDEEFHAHMPATEPPVMPKVVGEGPSEVVLWADVVTDREGHIREVSGPIKDTNAPAARDYFTGMMVTPFVRNDRPVQAVGRIFITFKIPRDLPQK